jgi:exonuclease V gamma subunit
MADIERTDKKWEFASALKALCDQYGVTMDSWYMCWPETTVRADRYFVSEDIETGEVFWQIKIDERLEREINGR